MKFSESKLHMVIETNTLDEGILIAQRELKYIHDKLRENVKAAKASAYNINDKGFAYYREKLIDKDLIIESAGQLRNDVLDAIEDYIVNRRGNTIFALVDIVNNLDRLASDRPGFLSHFDVYSVLSNKPQEELEVTEREIELRKHGREYQMQEEVRRANTEKVYATENTEEKVKINREQKEVKSKPLGSMSIEEFVEECKSYADSIDCVIEEASVKALYEKVEDMVSEKMPLNHLNAVALIEEAADRSEKPKLFHKAKYDKDGCLILTEESFRF